MVLRSLRNWFSFIRTTIPSSTYLYQLIKSSLYSKSSFLKNPPMYSSRFSPTMVKEVNLLEDHLQMYMIVDFAFILALTQMLTGSRNFAVTFLGILDSSTNRFILAIESPMVLFLCSEFWSPVQPNFRFSSLVRKLCLF